MKCTREAGRHFIRHSLRVLIVLISPVFVLLLAGCGHNAASMPVGAPRVAQAPVLSEEYVLQPYDVVEVKFLNNPELNETVTIRPDGRISLQMVDEIRAAGLTPAQLDDLLTQKFNLLLNKAMITVVVRTFTSDRVYVGGEVKRPQVLVLTGRMNALQAIFMAGGFKPDARKSEVIIVSRGPDNRPVARKVNLSRALKGTLDYEEYRLRPFDVVYVPRTTLASLGRFMTHIYRLLPPQVSFWFTYEVHDEEPDAD
ncbi:MAG TPA: polysaccharide biosynthesis/export family protein [Deltaproteobacteria bacterium]|nr:polysaccharide biosynthesis/export family protein [Deltaproteobacteria bacterium]